MPQQSTLIFTYFTLSDGVHLHTQSFIPFHTDTLVSSVLAMMTEKNSVSHTCTRMRRTRVCFVYVYSHAHVVG